MAKLDIFIIVGVIVASALIIDSVFISNLDASCMRCLCAGATGCNMTIGCVKGYCGPFYLAKVYWADSGKYVLPEDDPQRDGAYPDCANEYNCAKYIVENYMVKYGRDCNNDGVTDCDDYAMIHYNGGFKCDTSLEGSNFYNRYVRCRPPKPEEEEEEVVEK